MTVDGNDTSHVAIPASAVDEMVERARATVEEAGSDIVAATPDGRRAGMASRLNEVEAVRSDIAAMTAQLKADLDARRREMERQFQLEIERLNAELEPLQERAEILGDAVDTLTFLMGTEETIRMIREGAPAAPATPITVYQSVLFMAEERALHRDVAHLSADAAMVDEGALPVNDGADDFFDWLLADESHLRQVCPAERGIVALQANRPSRDRHGRRSDFDSTFFLFVNGETVGWVVSSFDFEIGSTIIPHRGAIDAFFLERVPFTGETRRIQAGSRAWAQAEKAAGRHQRHYFKIAAIIQGVIERSTLMCPLPADEVSVIDAASFDAGHVVAVVDDDGSRLGTGFPSFTAWQRSINATIDVGSRVVLSSTPLCGRDEVQRVFPRTIESGPSNEVPHTVKKAVRRSEGAFSFSFKRTDEVWREMPVPGRPGWVSDQRVPSAGYGTYLFWRTDSFVLAIDHPEVTIEAIDWYLRSRSNRHEHRSMVPLLKMVRRILVDEAERERPFIDLLASQAVLRFGIEHDVSAVVVPEAVATWKLATTKHRSLVPAGGSTTAGDAKVFESAMREVERHLRWRAQLDSDDVVQRLRRDHGDAVMIGRRIDGAWIVATPMTAEDEFVRVDEYTSARATLRSSEEWVTFPKRSTIRVVWQSERGAGWPARINTSRLLTGPQKDAAVSAAIELIPDALGVTRVKRGPSWDPKNTLEVAVDVGEPEFNLDRPLTGRSQQPLVRTISYAVSLRDGEVLLTEQWGGSVMIDQFDTGDQWLHRDRERFAVLSTDHLAAWSAFCEHRDQIDGRVAALRTRAIANIEAALVDTEYRRFLSKYGAEATGRWDAHRASIDGRLTAAVLRTSGTAVFESAVMADLDVDAESKLTMRALLRNFGAGYRDLSDSDTKRFVDLEF